MLKRNAKRQAVIERAFDPSHRGEWLGGEAQVRFRDNLADRRSPFRHRKGGFTSLTVLIGFLGGLTVGCLLIAMTCSRQRR